MTFVRILVPRVRMLSVFRVRKGNETKSTFIYLYNVYADNCTYYLSHTSRRVVTVLDCFLPIERL